MAIKLSTQKLASMRLAQKKALYKQAKKAYYNQTPIMSDESFDLLEDDLKNLAPDWSGLKKTGAPVAKNIKRKVNLPVPMFSLDKKKPESVGAWLTQQSGPVVVSLKADGASLELIYKDGVPVQAITRGDGRIGGDVSYLIPHMKVPQKVGTASFILRCEAIFTARAFARYKEVFDAARNAASGLLNRQDVHEAVKDLSIVVLQVLKPNAQLSKGLAWAKAKGFAVIPHKVVSDVSKITSDALVKILESQRAKAKFQIDGLVVALDRVNALPKAGNPDWAIAFKTPHAGVVTKVKAVHWDVSHQGYLIPRIEYNPVEWEGSTLTFATAFNARYIEDNHVGPGSVVEIVRSGDIIPYIKKVKVDAARKPSLPSQKQFGGWHWDKSATHIVLDVPKDNDDFRIKRLARFFTEMDADFMREKTVRRLYERGLTNLTKILSAHPQAFLGDGITADGAMRLHTAIHKAIGKKVPLTKLMNASSTFPRGMGERRFQSLGQVFDLLKLVDLPSDRQVHLISQVPGWNTTTAQAFVAGLPKFIKWLEIVKVPYVNDTGMIKIKKKVDGPLNGLNVSWTGYRSKDEEATVEKAGGTIVSFGSKTNVLLYSAEGKASSKVDKAQARGIKTMTWQQFSRKYGL